MDDEPVVGEVGEEKAIEVLVLFPSQAPRYMVGQAAGRVLYVASS